MFEGEGLTSFDHLCEAAIPASSYDFSRFELDRRSTVGTGDFLNYRHGKPLNCYGEVGRIPYFLVDRNAAATAKAPINASTKTITNIGFIPTLTMYSEPPTTTKSMPQPKVLKVPSSFSGFTALIPATMAVQMPLDRRINGTRLLAVIKAKPQAAIQPATIIKKTPKLRSLR